jgi:hypothetical protein
MERIYCQTIVSKAEAKRLFNFFPVKLEDKAYAGRKITKKAHINYGADLDNQEEVENAISYKEKKFGHLIQRLSGQDGFSCLLKWSQSCQDLQPEDLVVVQLFKVTGKTAWIFRVAPVKAKREEFNYSGSLRYVLMPKGVRFDFNRNIEGRKEQKFFLRFQDISENSAKTLKSIKWIYDVIVEVQKNEGKWELKLS